MRPLGLLVSFSLFASTATIINFDTAPLGKTPPGWWVAASAGGARRWEILQDQSAPTQPYVFAYSSNQPRSRSPIAIFDRVNLRDGDLSVRIKPVSGQEILGGGLVWRYIDESNYYLVRADAIDKTVTVFKVQNGVRIPLTPGARRAIRSNDWNILKVSARGRRFQVYVDHRRILQGWDQTFTGAGKVGLWTDSAAVTYFDDFRVNPR